MSARHDNFPDSLVPVLIVDDDVKLCRLNRESVSNILEAGNEAFRERARQLLQD